MKDAKFWSLLDAARTGSEIKLEALNATLQGLSISALERFDQKLRGKISRLSNRAVRKALIGNPEMVDRDG